MKKNWASQEETRACIQNIRAFYDLGRMARRPSSDQAAETPAGEQKWKAYNVANARRFAGRYTQQALEMLCEQIGKHCPSLGISHVCILITVPRAARCKLESACIQNNWSLNELQTAKTKRCRPKSRGGRPPQVTVGNGTVRLQWEANRFCRLAARMRKPLKGKPPILDSMPGGVRQAVEAACSTMKSLQEQAQNQLRKAQDPDE